MKRDILRRSSVGLILTSRNPMVSGGGSNQVRPSTRIFVLRERSGNSYYARVATTAQRRRRKHRQFQYAADRYGFELQRLKVGDAFKPEVGFLRRIDSGAHLPSRASVPDPTIQGLRRVSWASADLCHASTRSKRRRRPARSGSEFDSSAFALDYRHNYEFLLQPFKVTDELVVPGRRVSVFVSRHPFTDLSAG